MLMLCELGFPTELEGQRASVGVPAFFAEFPTWCFPPGSRMAHFVYTVTEKLLVSKATAELQRMDALGHVKMPQTKPPMEHRHFFPRTMPRVVVCLWLISRTLKIPGFKAVAAFLSFL